MNEWVPALPPPPQDPGLPLPPANSWNDVNACAVGPGQPAITDSILITGVPATITAVYGNNYVWGITLNDGASPANFTIDRYDASGVLVDHPLEFSGANGAATFSDPVFMPAATAASLQITLGPLVVPGVQQLVIPGGPIGSYLGSAGTNGVLTWFQPPAPIIPTDAPNDGQVYARQSQPAGTAPNWVPIVTGSSDFLPLTGGTMTGGIDFDGSSGATTRYILGSTGGLLRWALLLGDNASETGGNAGSNFIIQNFADNGNPIGVPFQINRASGAVTLTFAGGITPLNLNGPAGSWRSISGQTNGSMRWQLYLGNPTGELGSNFGSNFQLNAYSDAGALISSPLQIARATGVAAFSATPTFPTPAPGDNSTNGATTAFVTGSLGNYMPVTGGLFTGAVGFNVGATFAGPANISIGGGASGNVLTTNGLGTLSWTPPAPFPEAPTTGLIYGRRGSDASWQVATTGPPVIVGDTPPASPVAGTLWFDSVGGQTYVWYNDGNSSQWVIAVNASGTPTVSIGALPPGNASVGQLWWDGVGAQLFVLYNDGNSTQWVPTSNQLGGGYLPLSGGTTTGPVSIRGVTDGSNAAAGQVGEFITANAANTSLTNGVWSNIATISLTPGDWDVWGQIQQVAGTNMVGIQAAISLVSATPPSSFPGGGVMIILPSTGAIMASIGTVRFSFTATTTVYLMALQSFSGGSASATPNSFIQARRAR